MTPPVLTVVVVVLVGGTALERCLAVLRAMPVNILVIGRLSPVQAASCAELPVRVIDSTESVPRRRAQALALTTTPWIAFCEDTCEPAVTWFAAFTLASQEPQVDAWSGPITLRPDLPARCLALAALEYGEFTPARWSHLSDGPGAGWRPMSRLAGLNLLYRTKAVASYAQPHGIVETEVHLAMRAAGRVIALHPGLAVSYSAADPAAARCRARVQHGRIYGGGVRARSNLVGRAVALVKCLALPSVLWARGAAALPATRRVDLRVHLCLWLLATAWSAGEAIGVACGRGRSLEAWH
jgi:hypothetical protein